MKIVGRPLIDEFIRKHADARSALETWLSIVRQRQWSNSIDMKKDFPKASVLGGQRVIFDIRGNRYRMDSHVIYVAQVVRVNRLGTHEEYDKWDL